MFSLQSIIVLIVLLSAGSAEAYSHGAVLGEQSGRPHRTAVPAQSPFWNTPTRTVW